MPLTNTVKYSWHFGVHQRAEPSRAATRRRTRKCGRGAPRSTSAEPAPVACGKRRGACPLVQTPLFLDHLARIYHTLFPHTLLPKMASKVTSSPRFDMTIYFIWTPPSLTFVRDPNLREPLALDRGLWQVVYHRAPKRRIIPNCIRHLSIATRCCPWCLTTVRRTPHFCHTFVTPHSIEASHPIHTQWII